MARILHVLNTFRSVPSFLAPQLQTLREHGHETFVAAGDSPDLIDAAALGIEAFPLPIVRTSDLKADAAAARSVARLARRVRPDIVHTHSPKASLIGLAGAKLAGVRHRVQHLRGLPHMTSTGWKRRLIVAAEQLTSQLATLTICVSPSIRQQAIDDRVLSASRSIAFGRGSGSGIDARGRFDPTTDAAIAAGRQFRQSNRIADDAVVIGFLGRLMEEKGIGTLAHAWSRLRSRHPEAILAVVGPVDDRLPLPESLLTSLRSDPQVRLLCDRWYPPTDIYPAIDVFALPSFREGFGMTALEANAMAIPVVASRIPGCLDSVDDGVTGTLATLADPAELAEAIETYLVDPLLRRRHGQAGRRRALDLFDPTRFAAATASLYDGLAGGRLDDAIAAATAAFESRTVTPPVRRAA